MMRGAWIGCIRGSRADHLATLCRHPPICHRCHPTSPHNMNPIHARWRRVVPVARRSVPCLLPIVHLGGWWPAAGGTPHAHSRRRHPGTCRHQAAPDNRPWHSIPHALAFPASPSPRRLPSVLQLVSVSCVVVLCASQCPNTEQWGKGERGRGAASTQLGSHLHMDSLRRHISTLHIPPIRPSLQQSLHPANQLYSTQSRQSPPTSHGRVLAPPLAPPPSRTLAPSCRTPRPSTDSSSAMPNATSLAARDLGSTRPPVCPDASLHMPSRTTVTRRGPHLNHLYVPGWPELVPAPGVQVPGYPPHPTGCTCCYICGGCVVTCGH